MSRLNDLIRELRGREPALARDLEREVAALAERRAFGLNFERHVPEAVELPGRKVRGGDKVRVLPPRAQMLKKSDEKLWRVVAIDRSARSAQLETFAAPLPKTSAQNTEIHPHLETKTVSLDDLVVVAEFRDAIYPGLVSTGKVERGGDKPFHTVINAENFHALETLLFTHRSKVDAIYIDPPYNTRDRDWKYNNDYVNADDLYRHSKWLAMMERRLRVAKELLNPSDSVLIVTIDEKEYLRLGLLLEQVFPEAAAQEAGIQMVTSVISAKGAVRSGKFSRVEEQIFIIALGKAIATPWYRNMLNPVVEDGTEQSSLEWLGLRRREPSSKRGARPNQFYPIFVHENSGLLHSVGAPIADGLDRDTVQIPERTVVFWPLKPDGTEMLWGLTPDVLRRNWANGFARVNSWNAQKKTGTIQYLPGGTISQIQEGTIRLTGKSKDGSVIGVVAVDEDNTPPKRVWNLASHNAEMGGTNVLSSLLPGRHFPFPKSLYAVEDVLRFFVVNKPAAIVLDFFSGSGTTAHAVMRLNKLHGGRRQCISVTNNEVAADEEKALREKSLRPGDVEWGKWGICDYITKPRVQAAITGKTPAGQPIKGDYKFTDEFPMADGFEENAEFFTLTYEAPLRVASNREFTKIAPLLWMRAGSQGRRIDDISKGWDVADKYGVLSDLDRADIFLKAAAENKNVGVAFIVTDDDRLFESVAQELPSHVEPVRLYESYLRNFEIESGRGAL